MACVARRRAVVRPSLAALALCAGVSAGGVVAASQLPDRAVSIELRPRVSISQAQVRLGDIAYLTSRDLPLLRRLMALQIGPAPRPGAPVQLDRDTVMRWVEARSGWPVIQWGGAGEIEIESASQQLPGESIVDAARSALERWLSGRSVRAEVQPVSTARDLTLPAGATTLRVRPLASQGMPTRRMLVWVDAWVDDRFVRSTAVSFEVGAWAPLAVASVDLERSAPLDPIVLQGGLERREVDLTTMRGRKPAGAARAPAKSKAGNRRLRRPLRAGEVITQAHLETAPAVTRGGWADLVARSGNVSIESRVEVLQDGRLGDRVRVKVPGANGEVVARVTGPGQVEAQP